jgi:7,8-dihydro-6-hydroxymethylpterin-pyrophosphokinase
VDIDLLLFGEEVIDGQDFQVSHRGISRSYNLVELTDLTEGMTEDWWETYVLRR